MFQFSSDLFGVAPFKYAAHYKRTNKLQ